MEFLILLFVLIYTQFKNTLNQNTQTAYRLEPMLGTKSILLEDNMIYIFNNESDFSINFINPEISKASYSRQIKYNKNIVKKNDSSFIIIGLNDADEICFENYAIIDNNLTITRRLDCYYITYRFPDIIEARYIEQDKLIIYTFEYRIFRCYLIDFKNNTKIYHTIEIASLQNERNLNSFPNPNIRCDSLDGFSYFCIFYYRTTNQWKMNYTYGNFSTSYKVTGSLCNDLCTYGNIIKVNVNDILQKYLICYVKIDFSSYKLYNIICQYYYFENGKMIIEKNYDLCKDSGKSLEPRPLILYSYKNSMFIQYDYQPGEGRSSRIIIFSPDLKFNIHSNIYAYQYSSYESVNLFNNDDSIFLIFESGIYTYITEQALIYQGRDENITLSKENDYTSFFYLNNKSFVAFSLDENIILSKNNEIIDGNNLLDLSNLPPSQTNFSIKVKNNAVGVFNSYIILMENLAEGNYMQFSLIKKITVTICYESCQKCIFGKVGTFNENFCINCSNNFYQNISDNNSTEGFNCYNLSDPRINNYFLDKDNKYNLCNETCKTCNDSGHCLSCSDNFYFKTLDNKILEGLCFPEIKEKFYLDINADIDYKGSINKIVYKECYNSCLTCKEEGNYTNNNCIECDKGFTKYPFSEHQCLNKTEDCLNVNKYWELKNNNIECIQECNNYIILDEGKNKGQCVENCQNFNNPFLTSTLYFNLRNCNNLNYCIPLELCIKGQKLGQFTIDYESYTCNTTSFCNISIFDQNASSIISNQSEKFDSSDIIEIKLPKQRSKIWRILEINETYLSNINYEQNLIRIYKEMHERLSFKENEGYGIYLILTINFINFNITIYPINIEEFVYDNIIDQSNLSFIYFKESLISFVSNEGDTEYILVFLLERICNNSAINELNYFFIKFNDDNYKHEKFDVIDDLDNDKKLNVYYALKNYVNNNNSGNNKRKTEYLVDNIKEMHKKHPEIDLSNINDSFFNDICFIYTTEYDTDITLNDRREEFYVNESLCESNCFLDKIVDKETKIVKSLCKCEIKYNYTFNENPSKKDEPTIISSHNIDSFLCIREVFKSQNISKNPIFWLLLIIMIFFILMIFSYIVYANKIFKRMFNFGKENLSTNSEINNNKNSNTNSMIKMIENNKEPEKDKEKENSKTNEIILSKENKIEQSLSKISKIQKQESLISNENINIIQLDKVPNNKIDFSKIEFGQSVNPNSAIFQENNSEKIEVKNIEKNSYKYNPPKKNKETNKDNRKLIKKYINDNNVILEDISTSKNIKNSDSEISYEKISKEKAVYVDNLVNRDKILENNYLDYPLKYENNLFFEVYKDALDLSEEEKDYEINKILFHFNTMEDYYTPESKENKNKKSKNRGKKNPRVTKLLGGEDLFNKSLISNESDNYDEKAFNKKIRRTQTDQSNEDSLFNNNKLLIKKGSKKLLKKKNDNKDNPNDLIIQSYQESENSEEKNKNLKSNKKKKKSFMKFFGKKDSEENDDSNYGNEEEDYYKNNRLKTDYDYGGKLLIKSKLKKLGKEGLASNDNSTSSKNDNYKSFNTPFGEKKDLIFSNNNISDNSENKGHKISKKKSVKRKNPKFKEEGKNNKDDKEQKSNIKKRNPRNNKYKNKKEEFENKESVSIILDKNKDFDIFYEKALGSSIATFLETSNEKIITEENIFKYFWKYFRKRELFLVCFLDKKDTIPFFVRWSSFFFCLIFILMLNCLFFFVSNVHKRYQNASQGKNNNIVYYFKHEFVNTIYATLISIFFKMIIIKLVLYRTFKVKKTVKKMMQHSFEIDLDESELDNLVQKRYDYLSCYHIKLIIYFCLLMILGLFFSYICVCYGGVFPNSINAFFFGFVFSALLSFIICALFCFIIVSINKIARACKNRCLLSTYVVLSTIY